MGEIVVGGLVLAAIEAVAATSRELTGGSALDIGSGFQGRQPQTGGAQAQQPGAQPSLSQGVQAAVKAGAQQQAKQTPTKPGRIKTAGRSAGEAAVHREAAAAARAGTGPKPIDRPTRPGTPSVGVPRTRPPVPQRIPIGATARLPGQAPIPVDVGPQAPGLGSRLLAGARGFGDRAKAPIGDIPGLPGPISRGLGKSSPVDLLTFGAGVAAPLLLGGGGASSPKQRPIGTASQAAAEAAERERRRLRGRGRASTFATKGRSLGRANVGATSLLGR